MPREHGGGIAKWEEIKTQGKRNKGFEKEEDC